MSSAVDYYEIIAGNFQSTIETIAMSVDKLAAPIEEASQQMSQALLRDRKIFVCGNGTDAAQAQLFCSSLLVALEQDRPALPAFCLSSDASSLTAIAATSGEQAIFSRQLRALGQAGDVLLWINSGPTSAAITAATDAAHERNMPVVALSNSSDSAGLSNLNSEDTALTIESKLRSRTLELHTMTLNTLCQLVELNLFGSYNQD